MRKVLNLIGICFFVLLVAGQTAQAKPVATDVEQRATEYFQVYAARNDFKRFMAFYAENVVFEDVLYQVKLNGSDQLAEFFDWSRGEFRVLEHQPALTISSQLVQGNTVVTQGVFNRFSFQGKELGPWQFSIWLTFDQEGKIIAQQDWINYTPKTIDLGL